MKEEKTLSVTAEKVTLFGRFALARESRRLYAQGQPLSLSERAMDVLIALLDARGKIVSIEQLQQRLWPSASIVANSVQALVSQLRRALGDDRDLLETVPRRGYRLAAEWYEIRDDLTDPGSEFAALAPETSALPDEPRTTGTGRDTGIDGDSKARLPLIGRDAELSELVMRVQQHRLVTLVGARGTGKTRLTHEAALRSAALFHDGVVFIDLADLTLPARVAQTIAAQLAPRPQEAPGLDGLIARLAGGQTLLIIEDCDHLAQEVATVVDALLSATRVCVIVCAEAPLFIAGEYLLPLAPLRFAPRLPEDAPDLAADAPPSDACRLFVAQLEARGALPADEAGAPASHGMPVGSTSAVRSAPTHRSLESVCRALSGNPLALELAANQIARALRNGVALAEAVADWDMRWRHSMLQRAGSREVALRPAALVPSVIAHAYYALDTDTQHVLCCTSLFAAPFDLADAHAVATRTDAAGGPDGESVTQAALSILIDAGLLIDCPWGAPPHPAIGPGRMLRMPPAVRQFALGVLAHRFDYASVAARHAQRVAEWVGQPDERGGECNDKRDGEPGGKRARETPAPRAPMLADVRRAVGWSIEAGRFEIAARLLQHSGPIWTGARLTDEWLVWIRRTLHHDVSRPTLKVRDHMLLYLALAQAMQRGTPSPPPADTIAAWWRVYELATACADDDNRLRALSVLLMRTLEAGFNDDSPDLLANVRARIAQECDGSSTHRGFALLRGVLLTLNGRHDEAISLLAPPEENAPAPDTRATEAGPQDARQPDYVAAVSHNALAISLWLTGARANSHPMLQRALQDARQQSDPLSRCTAAAMACVLFLLEDNAPRIAQQARMLCEIAQRAGLQSWLNAGRSFLLWTEAADDNRDNPDDRDKAKQLTDLALRNLARGHATMIDLLVLDRFAGLALNNVGGPVLIRLFERMVANLQDSGRKWLLPEALRVNAVLGRHAGLPAADVSALLDRAAYEARRQSASMFARRIAATMEQMAPLR